MATFFYKARTQAKTFTTGVIDAESISQAFNKIIQLGCAPIEILPQKEDAPTSTIIIKKLPLSLLTVFTRQMADLLDARIPVLQALKILSKQTKNVSHKAMIEHITQLVGDGANISESLSKYPQNFSFFYISMIKSGELSGQLSGHFNQLAIFMKKEEEFRSKIKSSLMYPGLVFAVGLLTIFVLLTFVLPRLTTMFDEFETSLPLATIIVVAASKFFAKYWLGLVAISFGAYFLLKNYLESPEGRGRKDQFLLAAPVLGPFMGQLEISHFARTLGTLLASGVDMSAALNVVEGTIDNSILKKDIMRASKMIKEGTSLSKALQSCSYFTDMSISMIAIGEESGKLHEGLLKLAEIYEQQTQDKAHEFVTLLGPVVLVVIVAIIGFAVVAMLLPILQMNAVIH